MKLHKLNLKNLVLQSIFLVSCIGAYTPLAANADPAQIARLVIVYAHQFKKSANDFFKKEVAGTYQDHLMKMQSTLKDAEHDIIKPISASLATHRGDSSDRYKKIMSLLQEITKQLHHNLDLLRTALHKNQGSNTFVVAAALGNVQRQVDLNKTLKKVKELAHVAQGYDPELSAAIAQLENDLIRTINENISMSELLAGLKLRINRTA